MTVSHETLSLVRSTLTISHPECRVIVAPTVVGVYLNKCKNVLMKTALCHHWKFQYRGLLALVYHPVLNRLKLIVAEEKTGRDLWQETFGDYTNYEPIHAVFHILNSSKNFCYKIGLFYGDEKVANMVHDAMDAFTAQRRRNQVRNGVKGAAVSRSRSFNSSERVKIEVKLKRSYSNSMGDIKIQRTALSLLEDEAQRYVTKQTTRKSSFKRMISGIRSSFRVRRVRRQDTLTEGETLRRKRSRLSTEPDVTLVDNRSSEYSINTIEQENVNSLSVNWKLSDVELEQLYRLSYFKENNVPSTDLCTTEL